MNIIIFSLISTLFAQNCLLKPEDYVKLASKGTLQFHDFSCLKGKQLNLNSKASYSSDPNVVNKGQLPENIRVIKPGQPVSYEYNFNRLTVTAGDDGVIEQANIS
ncbi:hypothetical protein CONCODRAFT_11123 [Conidiobolus coronatus NRRL 28638]|uniref:Uncharacterized protein n=1 Tax=Conidiobolus coronatus (strain ATCC 28846 / CBS 209.66 / NRRL 28638) TaxID=796925 RepID=A0A137NVT9_CONC2|nr:hypothetical protein CONCODRAFT_11123 [Conidiobolus coronatus NRRL 28638]|eukprot:KXN66923.1 hypothetical protein CONCODRAFT_11123 [Conidiobolus coronatus NRRL 28638]